MTELEKLLKSILSETSTTDKTESQTPNVFGTTGGDVANQLNNPNNIDKEIIRQREIAEKASAASSQLRTQLDSIDGLLEGSSEEEYGEALSTAFGAVDTFFKGTVNLPEERSSIQSTIATIDSARYPDRGDARTFRTQLIKSDFTNAYDALRGGGHISNFEGQSAAAAQSLLSNPELSEKQAFRILTGMRNTVRFGIYRQQNNIKVAPNGSEYKYDDQGIKQNRVLTTTTSDGSLRIINIPEDLNVLRISDFESESEKKSKIESLKEGDVYILNGIALRKGSN